MAKFDTIHEIIAKIFAFPIMSVCMLLIILKNFNELSENIFDVISKQSTTPDFAS